MTRFLIALYLFSLIACLETKEERTTYHCLMFVGSGHAIPFHLHFSEDSVFYEQDQLTESFARVEKGDSIVIQHPVFRSKIILSIQEKMLNGYWHNYEKGNYKLRITGNLHNPVPNDLNFNTKSATWDLIFTEKDSSQFPGIAILKEEKGIYRGTILTETGDYRYLSGSGIDNNILLYTFDFAHAFLFTASVSDDSMLGTFYSGNHYTSQFRGKINDDAQLRNSFEIIGFDSSAVEFKMREPGSGKHISSSKYLGKPLIVQAFGTWCPNCYDEARFLSSIYPDLQNRGIELIALAFERPRTFRGLSTIILDYKESMDIPYALYYGGNYKKDSAALVFPFLDNFESFPTLIFLDKDHKVQAVHSGFYGPGTGSYFLETKYEIGLAIEKLATPQ